MNTLPRPQPLVTVILDGWGISALEEGNAIAVANTATMRWFASLFPTAALGAAGRSVGLPWGEAGNSESGHRNIGAGQVQYQILSLIDQAIADGSFSQNPVFKKAINHVKQNNSQLHLIGLVSSGGVHSHINHLIALLQLARQEKLKKNVYVHAITDGEDVPSQSASFFLGQLEEAMRQLRVGQIASVTGRLYAMDRNQNWHRTEAAYNMLVGSQRQAGAPSAQYAVEQAYRQNMFDAIVPPTVITRGGSQLTRISDNDAVIFFNFRADRARQLVQAFLQPDFKAFQRLPLQNLYFAGMAPYDPKLPLPTAYDQIKVEYPLARIISEAGLTQLHIAETEKYAHITYFLNTGYDRAFAGEKQVLIRSSAPKNFAERPHMATGDITDYVIKAIQQNKFNAYFINYANADMAGHTGDFEAAIRACTFIDACLNRLYQAIVATGGALVITADHGNAEQMINPKTHARDTEHSSNPVPFYYVNPRLARNTPRSQVELSKVLFTPIGVLADVAPTILEILHLPQPPSMNGLSLLNSL